MVSKLVRMKVVCLGAALAVLSACADPTSPDGINDPYEEDNRSIHRANLAMDRMFLKPASTAYGGGVPQPVRRGVGNFASNLGLPSMVVNNLLQLDIESALNNTFRFAINTTIGIGGVFDPAGEIGLEEHDTDFGETLYKWGVGEGRYLELPLVGPSTERHAVGRVVDLFTNPLSYAINDDAAKWVSPAAQTLSRVGDRYDYSDSVDAILYGSEDSYAQARQLYLDNRRFKLGVTVTDTEADEIDALFNELYGQ